MREGGRERKEGRERCRERGRRGEQMYTLCHITMAQNMTELDIFR